MRISKTIEKCINTTNLQQEENLVSIEGFHKYQFWGKYV
jgi:hypothetical protein